MIATRPRASVAVIVVTATALVVGGVAVTGSFGFLGGGASPDPGAELLRRARERVDSEGFEGEVVVEWRDAAGVHRSTVVVRGAQGSVDVSANRRFVSTSDGGFRQDDDRWVAVRDREAIDVVPEPSDKYDLQVRTGPLVAGRRTTIVDAVLPATATLVERVFVDDETGLMLRRERYADDGSVVRSVAFTSIRVAPLDAEPEVSGDGSDPETGVAARLGGLYRDPDRAGDGFEVIARSKGRAASGEDVAHLLYSDGLLTVSVYEQPGQLDWTALPEGGVDTEIDDVRGVRYSLPVGAAFIWERDGVVYTAVSDGPDDQTLAVAESVSAPRETGRLARLGRELLAPFELG